MYPFSPSSDPIRNLRSLESAFCFSTALFAPRQSLFMCSQSVIGQRSWILYSLFIANSVRNLRMAREQRLSQKWLAAPLSLSQNWNLIKYFIIGWQVTLNSCEGDLGLTQISDSASRRNWTNLEQRENYHGFQQLCTAWKNPCLCNHF